MAQDEAGPQFAPLFSRIREAESWVGYGYSRESVLTGETLSRGVSPSASRAYSFSAARSRAALRPHDLDQQHDHMCDSRMVVAHAFRRFRLDTDLVGLDLQ